jgi:hypothetical protein
MAELIGQVLVGFVNPYSVETYVPRDGPEACISFGAANGGVTVRYETYGDKTREVYRPKGLLAYTTAAKEYMRML